MAAPIDAGGVESELDAATDASSEDGADGGLSDASTVPVAPIPPQVPQDCSVAEPEASFGDAWSEGRTSPDTRYHERGCIEGFAVDAPGVATGQQLLARHSVYVGQLPGIPCTAYSVTVSLWERQDDFYVKLEEKTVVHKSIWSGVGGTRCSGEAILLAPTAGDYRIVVSGRHAFEGPLEVVAVKRPPQT